MAKKAVVRPPFREWLAQRLTVAAKLKCFKEERDPRTPEETDEFADELRSLWQRCKLLYYVPTKKQDWFHRSRGAQIRGLFAPNQRGKTTAGIAELLALGLGEEPWSGKQIEKVGKTKWRPGMRFFVAGKDYAGGINEVILPKMNEFLPLKELGVDEIKMSGRITHKLIFPEPYRCSFKFLSHDQDRHKSEGMTWNGGWFDEPPPNHLYVSCRRGCLRHAAPMWFTGTPLNEPWMYDEIYASESKTAPSLHIVSESELTKIRWNVKAVIKIDHDEFPPGVTQEQIDAWAETLDEDEKRSRIYGEFFDLQGRVYKTFSRKRPAERPGDEGGHVIPRDEWMAKNPSWREFPGFCVVDPHDRKPFAFAWGVVTPRDEIIFIDEWPDFDFTKQKSWRWALNEYGDMIRRKERDLWRTLTQAAAAGVGEELTPNVLWRIMDPNFGRTRKAGIGITLEDAFTEIGFDFDTSVDDDVDEGHLVVKRALYEGRLFFLDNCTNTIKAMENYVWDEYQGKTDRAPKEKPRDKFKDFADLVRYVCKSDLHWMPPGGLGVKNPWVANGLG